MKEDYDPKTLHTKALGSAREDPQQKAAQKGKPKSEAKGKGYQKGTVLTEEAKKTAEVEPGKPSDQRMSSAKRENEVTPKGQEVWEKDDEVWVVMPQATTQGS